jgi:hypothetical protein
VICSASNKSVVASGLLLPEVADVPFGECAVRVDKVEGMAVDESPEVGAADDVPPDVG